MINVIFDDNVDFYFARERVAGAAHAGGHLPAARASSRTWPPTPRPSGRSSGIRSKAKARTWAASARSRIGTSATQLKSVPGVADVASVGGMPIEYQIDVDPVQAPRLQRNARRAVFGRCPWQFVGRRQGDPEGRGRIHRPRRRLDREPPRHRADRRQDRRQNRHADHASPSSARSAAAASSAAACWRKTASEAVGAVVLMRQGENPLQVTQRIKAKIEELQPGLPEGVRIVPFYDRTRLIHGAIEIDNRYAP